MKNLNEDFLLELFKLLFRKRIVVEVCIKHLKYHFLPSEEFKELWKLIMSNYQAKGDLTSIGLISQEYNPNIIAQAKVLDLIKKIKDAELVEEEEVLKTLEKFLLDAKSVEFGDTFFDLYNKGKRDQAREYMVKVAEEINNFSIIEDTSFFEPIFGNFENRQSKRRVSKELGSKFSKRIPFGIDELDELTHGGADTEDGDLILLLAQSGKGKTKFLRHFGVNAARRGFKGLHVQLEGTQKECEDGYDTTWTAESKDNIKYGSLSEDRVKELNKTAFMLRHEIGGEVYVFAPEKFGAMTTRDLRNLVLKFIKLFGFAPEFLIVDYLELLEPGDGKMYGPNQEKARRQQIGKELKNICIEFKSVGASATQSSDVSPSDLEDPDFYMTRHHLSGDKNAINPFSFVFTFNQTSDEYKENLARLYTDKIRNYPGMKIVKIYQAYDYDKFYDRKKTMELIHGKKI